MTAIYGRCGRSVVAVQNVGREETRRYGIVRTEKESRSPHRIGGIVEKPDPDQAPSTLGVVGRYILTPRIFYHLQHQKAGTGGEIQPRPAFGGSRTPGEAKGHRRYNPK